MAYIVTNPPKGEEVTLSNYERCDVCGKVYHCKKMSFMRRAHPDHPDYFLDGWLCKQCASDAKKRFTEIRAKAAS